MDLPLHQSQTGVALTIAGDFPFDNNVVSQLPEGTKFLSADQYGSSDWTFTARIDTQSPHGTLEKYFLKYATEDAGQIMMEGEYWAMKELCKTIPPSHLHEEDFIDNSYPRMFASTNFSI